MIEPGIEKKPVGMGPKTMVFFMFFQVAKVTMPTSTGDV
jgi:hypothetical protein